MHIAFLTTEYPILGMKCGGIGIFIKHLSHLIVKSETGVKVSVVYWGNKFTETVWDDGISVIPINQPHKSPFSSFINRRYLNKKLNLLVAKIGIDLVESIDWEGPLAFCSLSVPVVTRLHGSNVYFDHLSGNKTPWNVRLMEYNALRNSDAYIGVSRQALDLTDKLFSLSSNKRKCVIYNPVDINMPPLSVTVFTPVYNRKNLIGNLYQSLLSQTYKNFEWIIVDDGSTDDIDEIIKSYQNEDRILIRFIKQENGGKHRAINNGVLHAKGELFYIVDSDDYLTKDSIERIVFHYQYIKNNDKFAGVCGMKCFPDGSRIGKEVTWKILKDSWINYWIIKNIKGDVAFVFKTSVLRNYLFDDIPGEKFCAESLVLNRIGKNYLMLFFNEKIYIAEYLSDGLSVSSIKNRMNSPNYAMRIYSEMASLDIPYLKKIKAHINYWRFAPCSKLKMKNKIKQIGISSYIIFMPIGYLFHMKDKKNNYIDIRHVGSKR